MTDLDLHLRKLHDMIHARLTQCGYSPGEATELLAEYAATVLRARDARRPIIHIEERRR